MTCSKCGITPGFSCGTCKVNIHSSMDDLLTKIALIIESKWKIDVLEKNYLEFKVEDFKSFICKLIELDELTAKEASAINVLPLYKGESLNFAALSNSKLLSKLISLVQAEELLYILNKRKLISHFQPIVDVKDYSIYGYEILSRGIKEDGSIMPPFEMFKLAMESDLTFNLDRQARETAIINSAKENIKTKLFINFLPSVIYTPEVCLKTTTELINKFNFKPENITFEVVESEEIKDKDHLKNILAYYREKGFKIALDDLGSGYSSLNNLSKLYPDYIKIDLEIVRNIDKDPLKQAIFVALLSIARSSGIKVIAEGVERKEELEFVVSKGVDFVQGYYFAKPTEKPVLKI